MFFLVFGVIQVFNMSRCIQMFLGHTFIYSGYLKKYLGAIISNATKFFNAITYFWYSPIAAYLRSCSEL